VDLDELGDGDERVVETSIEAPVIGRKHKDDIGREFGKLTFSVQFTKERVTKD
jgi:hypothetical protein